MPNENKSTKTMTIVGFVAVFLAILVFSFGLPEGGCGGEGEVELTEAKLDKSQKGALVGEGDSQEAGVRGRNSGMGETREVEALPACKKECTTDEDCTDVPGTPVECGYCVEDEDACTVCGQSHSVCRTLWYYPEGAGGCPARDKKIVCECGGKCGRKRTVGDCMEPTGDECGSGSIVCAGEDYNMCQAKCE